MTQETINSLLSNGFAVGVAAFVLFRLEKEIKELTIAIEGLRRCSVCKLADDIRSDKPS